MPLPVVSVFESVLSMFARLEDAVAFNNSRFTYLVGGRYSSRTPQKVKPSPMKAGMKKVTEQEPSREILRVSKVLEQVGFNVQLLGSGNYVLQKLQALNVDGLERVREAFIKADHPRFFKFFSSGLPFGHMGDYERKVNAATLEQLAGLVKICGFLMQTKVYLFWRKSEGIN